MADLLVLAWQNDMRDRLWRTTMHISGLGQLPAMCSAATGNANLFDKVVGANGTLEKEEGPPGLGGPPSTRGRTHLCAGPATSRATAETGW
jgi:hypothetical protein